MYLLCYCLIEFYIIKLQLAKYVFTYWCIYESIKSASKCNYKNKFAKFDKRH